MPFYNRGRSSASMFQGRGVAAFISANEEDLPRNGTRIRLLAHLEFDEYHIKLPESVVGQPGQISPLSRQIFADGFCRAAQYGPGWARCNGRATGPPLPDIFHIITFPAVTAAPIKVICKRRQITIYHSPTRQTQGSNYRYPHPSTPPLTLPSETWPLLLVS